MIRALKMARIAADEITRRRIDSGSTPDYGLLLDIKGYRIGNSGQTQWDIIPVECTENIDPKDNNYLADILEKVVEVLRQ